MNQYQNDRKGLNPDGSKPDETNAERSARFLAQLYRDNPTFYPAPAGRNEDEDGDGDDPTLEQTLDFKMGYGIGYRQGLDYGTSNVRKAVFAYELNRRVKSAIMTIRWRIERFYYRRIRPDDIPI